MKKAGKPALLFAMVTMLGACGANGSKTVIVSDFCKRVSPPPENEQILDQLDKVDDPWQTWYGQLEADGVASCPEWSQ